MSNKATGYAYLVHAECGCITGVFGDSGKLSDVAENLKDFDDAGWITHVPVEVARKRFGDRSMCDEGHTDEDEKVKS